jgi:hypothetical protein
VSLEDRLSEALDSLLPHRDGEVTEDMLLKAFTEAVDRRERNSRDGGAVIEALQEMYGWTVRGIAESDGRIGKSSVARWSTKPPAD